MLVASNLSMTSVNQYDSIRVLVLRENWIGNTGLSLLNALLRLGTWASGVSEIDFVPLSWRGRPMKLIRRLLLRQSTRELNRALLAEASVVKPHLFVAVKGTFVTRETIQQLRQSGVVCYCFYPDVSFFAYGGNLPRALPEYDWIFTTKSFGPRDLRDALGMHNSSFLPHAYDPEVHIPRRVTPELLKFLGADVCFVGSWSLKKQSLLEGLVQRRPKLKIRIWGNSWDRLPRKSVLRQVAAFKPINGIGYASAISCSKINLGLLIEQMRGASSGDLITSRTFHIPACGGLMLHERTSDLLKIFKEGESCVCFEGLDELVAKVDELLANDSRRKAIAECGRRVVVSAHSWDHRARSILDHFISAHAKEDPLENRSNSAIDAA